MLIVERVCLFIRRTHVALVRRIKIWVVLHTVPGVQVASDYGRLLNVLFHLGLCLVSRLLPWTSCRSGQALDHRSWFQSSTMIDHLVTSIEESLPARHDLNREARGWHRIQGTL